MLKFIYFDLNTVAPNQAANASRRPSNAWHGHPGALRRGSLFLIQLADPYFTQQEAQYPPCKQVLLAILSKYILHSENIDLRQAND